VNGFDVEAPLASDTPTTKLKEPALAGVPRRLPVESSESPPVLPERIDQVYGGFPPDAVNGCEYGLPTIPVNSGAVVEIESVWGSMRTVKDAAGEVCPAESLTWTLNENVPSEVGVPERIPL